MSLDQSLAVNHKSPQPSNGCKLRWRQRFIKLTSWEYWPINVVYILPGIYFLLICARRRAWFFFSASNPGIPTGGMFFESKWDIFKLLPRDTFPTTILTEPSENLDKLRERMRAAELDYPIIAKPDRGERGWAVKILRNDSDLDRYRREHPIPFLLQIFADFPEEYSVFYMRKPDKETGVITSLTEKILLHVTGTGKHTLEELILADPRATLQYDTLRQQLGNEFYQIPEKGKQKLLVPLGNHCRGAIFLDRCAEIDESLRQVFDVIAKQVEGFYFGRFDVKARSLHDLRLGQHFSIVELNGSGAEPAHIYQPGYSFWKGQRVLIQHFEWMGEIAAINMQRGTPLMNWPDLWSMRAAQRAYRAKVKAL